MELISELWDKTTDAFSAATEGISNGLVRVFGNSNERVIRRLRPRVARINEMEPTLQPLSDEALKAKTEEFRRRLADGQTLDDVLEEAFAVCREAGRRFLKMRHYDVQLIGGMVLHGGNIAEMITGEGKTLVATLAGLPQRAGGQGRPRHHRQRLPRPARRGVDEPAVQRPGPDRRRDPVRHGRPRAQADLQLRHHLRHEQRVRLRLPPRQHEADPRPPGSGAS